MRNALRLSPLLAALVLCMGGAANAADITILC
jgi:hypothetical protein